MPVSRTRRELIGALAALPVAAAADPTGIIDTHTHFYDPSRPGGVPWPPKNDSLLYRRVLPADFRRVTSGLGVEGTVVVEASPLFEDNQWILDMAATEPAIVGFIGHLDPGAPEFPSQLVRFTRNPLFRGIRLNERAISQGLRQGAFRHGLQQLGDAGLTLDAIGSASMFPDVARVAKDIPKIKIVIDHLPFDRQPELPRMENVFAKVSGVRPNTPKASLDELWEAFGPSRVVYGSNWPVSEHVASYPQILKVVTEYFTTKGPEAVERYFRTNSRVAYGWVRR
jgi:predicted TIM-barrel fold metal-dependent hydrolase